MLYEVCGTVVSRMARDWQKTSCESFVVNHLRQLTQHQQSPAVFVDWPHITHLVKPIFSMKLSGMQTLDSLRQNNNNNNLNIQTTCSLLYEYT